MRAFDAEDWRVRVGDGSWLVPEGKLGEALVDMLTGRSAARVRVWHNGEITTYLLSVFVDEATAE